MFVDRLRRNSVDALSLFILPCVLALLPRRIGFAVMKGLARAPGCQPVTLTRQAANLH